MKRKLCSFFLMMVFVLDTSANAATFGPQNGRVEFSGEHAGMPFKGTFKQWQAEVVLKPLSDAKVIATFVLASAQTGNAMYDETLPEGDWFDVENTPEAMFTSHAVTPNGSSFDVSGLLTLRNNTHPVSFTLTPTQQGWAATFTIDRLKYDIGKDSDADAEWVSRYITMSISLGQ